ncbi:MAG: M14 family metallopeptidase [Patescibacteria group bacterium]
MKNIWIIVAALVALGAIIYVVSSDSFSVTNNDRQTGPEVEVPMPVEPDDGIGDVAEPLPEDSGSEEKAEPVTTIGESAGGEDIVAYHFGEGGKEVLFVGGVHSGFAPNTVAVAENLIEELESGSIDLPEDVRVTIVPNLNPDAPRAVNTLAGRLNENGVDLNRNFDCEWQEEGVWQTQAVSGGEEPFSEPEAAALRELVDDNDFDAVVVYYAAAGGVFASNCRGGVLPDTATLTGLYAEAAGYTAFEEFDFYDITGDMVNWLASEEIAAISVLLSDHQNDEWAKNKAGIEAVLEFVAE